MPDHAHPQKALIIGSGFGGSVAALRLAQAGYEVTVLERGKRWTGAAPFATAEAPDGRAAWLSTRTVDPLHAPTPIKRHAGLLDLHKGRGMTVLSAAGVGGGSLAFTGALVQPDDEMLREMFPWLDVDHLRACYDRVRSIIQPAPVPADMLWHDPHFEQARLFLAWARRAGLSPECVPMALDWEIVEQECTGIREAAYLAGHSWYGINSGARKSLDKNYLALAEATGRVEMRPLHVVHRISWAGEAGFAVTGVHMDEDGRIIRPFRVTSERVFLAAGSMGTTALLLRARATRTLPRLARNRAIGKCWGNNGDVLGLHRGHSQQATVAQAAAGVSVIHAQRGGLVRVMGDALNAAVPEQLVSLAMVAPPSGYAQAGSLTYHAPSDQVQVQWRDPMSQRLSARAARTYAFLDAASHQTAPTSHVQARLTAHPLGGMVLGTACHRHSGQVPGYPQLYVVDGALLPGWAGGVPPALTIAALAEYLLDHIIFTNKKKENAFR